MYADLHIHSTYSDGTNTPEEIVEFAQQNGVSTIALTDHDTIEGIPRIEQVAQEAGIHVLPGVEISTSFEDMDIHILGYFIDYKDCDFLNFLNDICSNRLENTKQMFEHWQKRSIFDYSWDRVMHHNKGKKWIDGAQVFDAMRKDQIFQSWTDFSDFYLKYFSKRSDVYQKVQDISPKKAIDEICKAKGIPVLAHPKLIGDDSIIDLLIQYGIQGIEVYYPAHKDEERKKYLDIAKNHNLLVTGGTDWHGEISKWNVEIGECGVSIHEINELNK